MLPFGQHRTLIGYRQWAKLFPPTCERKSHFPTTGGLVASLKSRQSNKGNEKHLRQMASDGMRSFKTLWSFRQLAVMQPPLTWRCRANGITLYSPTAGPQRSPPRYWIFVLGCLEALIGRPFFLSNHYDDTQSPLLMIFPTFEAPL